MGEVEGIRVVKEAVFPVAKVKMRSMDSDKVFFFFFFFFFFKFILYFLSNSLPLSPPHRFANLTYPTINYQQQSQQDQDV